MKILHSVRATSFQMTTSLVLAIYMQSGCSDSDNTLVLDDAAVGSEDIGADSEGADGADTGSETDSQPEIDSQTDVDTTTDTDTITETDMSRDTDGSASQENWTFAVMGDSRGDLWGVNSEVLSKLVSAVIEKGVDLVIFTGDVVDGTVFLRFQMPVWVEIMQPLWNAGIKVYPARGNHEAAGLNLNALATWQNAFVDERMLPTNGPTGHDKVTYSAVHKNALFVSLDHYVNPHHVPQDWLDQQLAATEVPHLFVFGHEPAFKVQHDDCLDDFPNKRDEFWQSLVSAGARVYFCGHDHFYDHAWVKDGDGDPSNDAHQYVVGTGGAEPRNWSPPYDGNNGGMTLEQLGHVEEYGYVLVEVVGRDVTLTWIGIDGDEGDSFSYTAK